MSSLWKCTNLYKEEWTQVRNGANESIIFKDLGLIPNRADPAVYSGIFQGNPVILGRATDDFLCACESEVTYKAIVTVFESCWTVHALGIVDTFFGLHFVSTKDCITIDQTV
jgi:hypothetical protein